jgi:hypothetical protein
MSSLDPENLQIVTVSYDDQHDSPHLWIAATARSEALKAVLRLAPLGSSAEFSSLKLPPEQLRGLQIRPRDVRDLGPIDSGAAASPGAGG